MTDSRGDNNFAEIEDDFIGVNRSQVISGDLYPKLVISYHESFLWNHEKFDFHRMCIFQLKANPGWRQTT